MKISIVEPVGGHGGMDYYDFGLCGGLAASGVDVILHTCDETTIPVKAGFVVRHTYSRIFGKMPAWLRGLHFVSGSFKAVASSVLENRRVIHLHFFHVGVLELMNALVARLMGRKLVITAHDVESFVSSLEVPFISRLAYRLAHRVIAHNRISRDDLQARLGVPERKIAVIPHGNYLHALGHMPPVSVARERLGIPPHAKVLLFFGQIKDVKGLDILLNAMPTVLQNQPDTLLLIAGRPWKSNFSAYEGQIESLGIREHCITHIRYIPDDEVPLYYSAADIVVLPYRRIYQSGVVLMAMSYGKPVIVSDLPGMTEIVIDGVNGYVFSQGQTNDLARKINIALAEMDKSQHLAEQGLQLMRDKYDWEMIGHKTAQLYHELVS